MLGRVQALPEPTSIGPSVETFRKHPDENQDTSGEWPQEGEEAGNEANLWDAFLLQVCKSPRHEQQVLSIKRRSIRLCLDLQDDVEKVDSLIPTVFMCSHPGPQEESEGFLEQMRGLIVKHVCH